MPAKRRNKLGPSKQWYSAFLRNNAHLFKAVKTKPIARVRVESHGVEEVITWHKALNAFIIDENILSENMHNFDESGFRVGCAVGEEVILPPGVREFYAAMAENRKSMTVVETVSAIGKTVPPVLIIQGKLHMES